MVGLQSLDLPIGVRIPVSQPFSLLTCIFIKENEKFYE